VINELLKRIEIAISELDLGVRMAMFATDPKYPINEALTQTGGPRISKVEVPQLARAARHLEAQVP